jgi:hypothetical protein
MNIPKPLVYLSVHINNITGGPRGWSLCARFWEARLNGNPLAKATVAVTDRIFWFDPQHCRKAWLLRSS